MIYPSVPVELEPIASALKQAALHLEEDADIFMRSPEPAEFDDLRRSIKTMKAAIAKAEAEWGII